LFYVATLFVAVYLTNAAYDGHVHENRRHRFTILKVNTQKVQASKELIYDHTPVTRVKDLPPARAKDLSGYRASLPGHDELVAVWYTVHVYYRTYPKSYGRSFANRSGSPTKFSPSPRPHSRPTQRHHRIKFVINCVQGMVLGSNGC